jgi:hypothetical protein
LTTRRRIAILAALLAALLGLAGQQGASADQVEAKRRRTWGCVHVNPVDVLVCLDDPIPLGPR